MRGSLVRLLAVSGMTLGTTVGAAVASAPVAGATEEALFGCASWIPSSTANYSVAACESGTGQYRAVAYCRNSSGGTVNRYGPFKSPVGLSYAYCSNNERIYDHAYQYK